MAEHFATCNLCDCQCGLSLTVDGDRVTAVRGDPEDIHSRGHICPKAVGLRELFEDPDRLRAPVVRDGAGWRTVGWEEALEAAAAPLIAVRERHGPDAVALYIGNPVIHSHRTTFAAAALIGALGTKNRFDANSQDGNPRLFACRQVYGDPLTAPVPDVDRTDFLLILGANPAVSHGSQLGLGDPRRRFEALRARGARIVLVDPRRSESASWATEHHFVRPGGDSALLLAMLEAIFAEGVDRADASGLPELRELAARFPAERVAGAIGMQASTIRALARDFASAPRACAYSRVGLCQSAFGPVATWLVEVLNVVTGRVNREGGAMFPAPAADIGPMARLFGGDPFDRWRSRVRGLPEFLGALPSAVMAEEMETPGEGQIRALVVLCGNPVSSTPNGDRLGRAVANLEHVVSLDFYVNETSRHAHVVLPPKHVFETGHYDLLLSRFGVRNTAKYNPPVVSTGDRDDWQIAAELALRLRAPKALRAAAMRLGRRLPEQAIDLLLRAGPYGLSLEKLRQAPHGIDLGPLRPAARFAYTRDGRVNVAPGAFLADVPRLEAWLDDAREGLVLIGRRQVRNDNSWMHNVPSLAKGRDRALLLMHPDDASRLGLVDGARVRIRSRVGAVEAPLSVSDEMMPGVVSLPHGFGHQGVAATLRIAGALAGPNANALTDELLVEPIIGTSIFNGVPVTVEASDGDPASIQALSRTGAPS